MAQTVKENMMYCHISKESDDIARDYEKDALISIT